MKRWQTGLVSLLACGSLWTPSEKLFVRSMEDESYQESILESHLAYEDIDQSLQDIQNLTAYDMHIELTDLDQNIPVAAGTIQVDNERGDAFFDMKFYEVNEESAQHTSEAAQAEETTQNDALRQSLSVYPLRVLTYSGFELAYINQVELLNTEGLGPIDEDIQKELSSYNHYYTPIERSELERLKFDTSVNEALQFLPNADVIRSIDPEFIKETDQAYTIDVERVEIPTNLFEQLKGFLMHVDLDMSIKPIDSLYRPWDVHIDQRFTVETNRDDFTIERGVKSDLSALVEEAGVQVDSQSSESSMGDESDEDTDESVSFEETTAEIPSKASSNQKLRTEDMTGKLTKASLQFHKHQASYVATLEGIGESINFDFFNHSSNQPLKSTRYRLKISIQPSEQRIPDYQSIPRMTNQEHALTIENLLTQAIE